MRGRVLKVALTGLVLVSFLPMDPVRAGDGRTQLQAIGFNA